MHNTLLMKIFRKCNFCNSYCKLFKQIYVYINCIFLIKVSDIQKKTNLYPKRPSTDEEFRVFSGQHKDHSTDNLVFILFEKTL